MWQGPHHSAQQSSRAGVVALSTMVSKLASVTVTGATAVASGALHFPQRARFPARSAGIRLTAPQFGQRISSTGSV